MDHSGSHVRRWWDCDSSLRRGTLGEGIRGYLAGLERRRRRIDKVLSLVLHPFLIVKFHVILVFPARTMRLAYTRRVVCQVGVAVITIILGHLGEIDEKLMAHDFVCKM